FRYDPTVKRVLKRVTNLVTNKVESTYYVPDATGNVMATYKTVEIPPNRNGDVIWEATCIYGSSRIGEERIDTSLAKLKIIRNQNLQTKTWFSYRDRGSKYFELGNHLGNVLATLSDRKLAYDNTSDKIVDGFSADIWTVNDYYPFGSLMPGRNYAIIDQYRFGFNGKENDNEIKGKGNYQDYGMRAYDGRLGRFFSVDPLAKKYPELTPYQFASNTPIQAIDLDGGEKLEKTRKSNTTANEDKEAKKTPLKQLNNIPEPNFDLKILTKPNKPTIPLSEMGLEDGGALNEPTEIKLPISKEQLEKVETAVTAADIAGVKEKIILPIGDALTGASIVVDMGNVVFASTEDQKAEAIKEGYKNLATIVATEGLILIGETIGIAGGPITIVVGLIIYTMDTKRPMKNIHPIKGQTLKDGQITPIPYPIIQIFGWPKR
ncbi:MAG TPA: RHS repeat-associated core domain-containing protein, partial [Saprospiraceae bacterium]|nr:RHS repeat-associated core domain-containing protein [Saprospiraceae bacterium]